MSPLHSWEVEGTHCKRRVSIRAQTPSSYVDGVVYSAGQVGAQDKDKGKDKVKGKGKGKERDSAQVQASTPHTTQREGRLRSPVSGFMGFVRMWECGNVGGKERTAESG